MTTIVVAMDQENGIGFQNSLLWHLPADLKRFKAITSGHPVIMGRKTYESIGKPLPNRTNIVISRRKDWFQEGILIVGSIKEALKFAKKIDEDIFIIGGGNIYEQTLELTDKLEVTRVNTTCPADTFFPRIDMKIWLKSGEESVASDEKNQFDMTFETFERIIPLDAEQG